MAYVKLAPLTLFLFATSLMFPTKNVETTGCSGNCRPWPFESDSCGTTGCRCFPVTVFVGQCRPQTGDERLTNMVEKHPNLCQSHADCVQKESESFCARYPNADIEYGWCFASSSQAEAIFNVAYSKSAGFLKMPVA